MTLTCCLDCGQPSDGPRCAEHTTDPKASAADRGYDAAWQRLSRRARKLQPFCTVCGTTDDLQTDHTPEAWARKAAGKAVRLCDVDVLCGHHNRQAGAARGSGARTAHGRGPHAPEATPPVKAKFESEIGSLLGGAR